MSAILGLIYNGRICISADTMLANLDNPNLNRHGFNKIFEFGLDGFNYLIGTVGLGEDLDNFLKSLSCYGFTKLKYSGREIANEMSQILKCNSISNLTLLVGSTNPKPSIFRVRMSSIEEISEEYQYFALLPPSIDMKLLELEEYIQSKSFILKENPLNFLKVVLLRVSEIDNQRFVNDDFYYKILENNKIEKPLKSDSGYLMT